MKMLLLLALLLISSQSFANTKRTRSLIAKVYVNNISPYQNRDETYRYYILPYCRPEILESESQSLGESLSGDRRMNSVYDLEFNQNVTKKQVCSQELTLEQRFQFQKVIQQSYVVEYFVGNVRMSDFVGFVDVNKNYYLKTQLDFVIYFNKENQIVHAKIQKPEQSNLQQFARLDLLNKDTQTIYFYYSATFIQIEDVVKFKQEHLYLEGLKNNSKNKIHWVAIINSFLLVLLLIVFVTIILLKIVKKDVSISRDLESDQIEDIGWKSIKTEALMAPKNKVFLSSFVGNGIQLLFLLVIICVFGLFNLFESHSKGETKTAGIMVYAFAGIINGYFSAQYYKYMGGKHWALNVIVSSFLFPVFLFAVWSFINTTALFYSSTAATPFGAVLFLILLQVLVNFPLTVLGSITGRIKCNEVLPNVESRLPRLCKEIPKKKFYEQGLFQFLIAGILPFSSMYLELYFVIHSVWGQSFYHLYGVLLVGFLLLVIVVICTSASLTYFQLNSMDYRWWWKSFVNGGSLSLFLFIYQIYYYFEETKMYGFMQFSYYFGYSVLTCIAVFFIFGTIGFLSSLKLVKFIYSQSKIE